MGHHRHSLSRQTLVLFRGVSAKKRPLQRRHSVSARMEARVLVELHVRHTRRESLRKLHQAVKEAC